MNNLRWSEVCLIGKEDDWDRLLIRKDHLGIDIVPPLDKRDQQNEED